MNDGSGQSPTENKVQHLAGNLQDRINALRQELESIQQKTQAFEEKLRSALINELIEEQELSVLYKQQKQDKKRKRQVQKRQGKNYQEPTGLKLHNTHSKKAEVKGDEAKELKRLYREAMLHVHPDKFAINEEHVELATEVTTQLIAIYQSGDLAALQAYHAHLFTHHELAGIVDLPKEIKFAVKADAYLMQEIEELERRLSAARTKHTYHVLVTYSDPMTFLTELKSYYQDRLTKLRRRTRVKKG